MNDSVEIELQKKKHFRDEEIDGSFEAPLVKNPLCEDNGCGKWEQPMIPNPEYKGKWRAPLLDNPNYQGKWAPRRIPNPDYFEDNNPFNRLTPIVSTLRSESMALIFISLNCRPPWELSCGR